MKVAGWQDSRKYRSKDEVRRIYAMDVEQEGGLLCLHNNKDNNLCNDSNNNPIGSHSNKDLFLIVGSSYELRVRCVESID